MPRRTRVFRLKLVYNGTHTVMGPRIPEGYTHRPQVQINIIIDYNKVRRVDLYAETKSRMLNPLKLCMSGA